MANWKYSKEQVQQAQKMRKAGFAYKDIAESLDMNLTSVLHHCHYVPVEPEHNHVVMRSIKDLVAMLQPGNPGLELPLPKGLLAFWEEELKE